MNYINYMYPLPENLPVPTRSRSEIKENIHE